MIPGLEDSPREGNGYPLQNFGLENSMERGTTVHGVTKGFKLILIKKKKNQFKCCILHIFCTKFLIINMDVLISRKRKKVFPFREKNK